MQEARGHPIEQELTSYGTARIASPAGTAFAASEKSGEGRRGIWRSAEARRTPSMGAFRGARRHSHFVQLMKFVLPVAALAIIISMALYAVFYETDDQLTVTFANSPSLSNDRSTVFPKFTIPTSDGRMFSVRANSAEAMDKTGMKIRLSGLKADITGIEGTDIRLRAKAGLLDLDAQTISISDDVHLISDEGYEFRTEHVLVNIEKQTVHGDKPVTGTSPMGSIAANKFWVLDKGKTLKFESGVVMNVTSAKMRRLPKQRPSGNTNLKGPIKTSLDPVQAPSSALLGAVRDKPE